MKGSIIETGKRIRKLNRGHRRAFSVPNATGDRTQMSVVEKNDFPVTVFASHSRNPLFFEKFDQFLLYCELLC